MNIVDVVRRIFCRHTFKNALPVGALPHGTVIATCTRCGQPAVH